MGKSLLLVCHRIGWPETLTPLPAPPMHGSVRVGSQKSMDFTHKIKLSWLFDIKVVKLSGAELIDKWGPCKWNLNGIKGKQFQILQSMV